MFFRFGALSLPDSSKLSSKKLSQALVPAFAYTASTAPNLSYVCSKRLRTELQEVISVSINIARLCHVCGQSQVRGKLDKYFVLV